MLFFSLACLVAVAKSSCGACEECGYEAGTCALVDISGELEECEVDADYFTSASVCEDDDGVYCADCLESPSLMPTVEPTPSPTAQQTAQPTQPIVQSSCGVCEECGYEVGTCALVDVAGELDECEVDADYFTSASVCDGDGGVYCADCLENPSIMPTVEPTSIPSTVAPTTSVPSVSVTEIDLSGGAKNTFIVAVSVCFCFSLAM